MKRTLWLLTVSTLILLVVTTERAAFAQGIFSTGSTSGGGDHDAIVGLDNTKTYFNAINVNGGNLTINGVSFTGNNGDGTWAFTNFPNTNASENASPITGQFGTLEDTFRYGNVPATQTVTLNGLTAGRTYITTFYNPNWDFGNSTARTSAITSTSGATFSYNENAGAATDMSILRYSFVASGASENINFNNTGAAGSTHLYGFTTEQAFNNNWTSGANWSTAVWSVSQPNAQGDNANFAAQGSPTTINLDANRIVGHVQFDGANAWTISGANTLTLQPDLGGVSVLSALTGSHTISAKISGSDPIIKLGAGTLTLSGNNDYSGVMNLSAGVLAIGSTNALGSTAGGTVQSGSSELRISGGIVTAAEALQINGGGISNAGALRNISSNNTYSGTVTLAGQSRINSDSGTLTLNNATAVTGTNQNLVIGGAGDVNISGAITTGTGFVAKSDGNSTLTLGGLNTFTGVVDITAGIVNVATFSNYGVAGGLGARTLAQETAAGNGIGIHLNGGTLQYTGSTAQSTDRQIRIINGTSPTIDASGTVPGATLSFTYSGVNTNLFDTGGTRTLTLTGTNTGNNTFAIPLADQSTNATSLTKSGTGTWVLSGTSAYNGNTTVNSGILNISGSITSTGSLDIGETVATNRAIVNVTGTVTAGHAFTGVSGASGALYLKSGGNITVNGATQEVVFTMGVNNNGYGYFNNSGGTLNTSRVTFGNQATQSNGTGVGLMSAGTINSTEFFILSRSNGGVGEFTMTGGTVNRSAASSAAYVGFDGAGRAELNINGGLFNESNQSVTFGGGAGWTGTGILNLNAGTLRTKGIARNGGANNFLSFNGGTLQSAATSASFLPATLNGVYVNGAFGSFAGGAVIDTNGFTDTIAANLLAPTGSGIATLLVATQGSGYIGAPHITISGTGTGATAIANMVDDGTGNGTFKVGSITITNPGVNYAGTPTFAFAGGGSATAATAGAVTTAANTSGGLTLNDTAVTPGALSLSGASTYTGATTITRGTLKAGVASVANVSGAFGNNSAVSLANNANAVMDITGFNTQIGSLTGGGGAGGNVTLGAATLTTGGDNTSPAAYAGVIAGTGGLTKIGTGSLTLSGKNGYTGGTVVNGGTLNLAGGANIARVLADNTNLTVTGATVNITSGTNTVFNTSAGTITLNASGLLTAVGDHNIFNVVMNGGTLSSSGLFVVNGNISATDNSTIAASMGKNGASSALAIDVSSGKTLINSGSIVNVGGNNGLTKTGAGTLTLSGTSANTYTGLTTVSNGTLFLSKTAGVNAIGGNLLIDTSNAAIVELGANEQIPDTSTVTISNGAKLILSGRTETIGGLVGAASASSLVQSTESNSNVVSSLIINTSGANSYDFGGFLRNSASGTGNTLALTKTGTGTQTLSNSNSFSGGTIVNQGTLAANSGNTATGALGGGNVTVNNGGTITVGTDNSLVGFTTSGARTITINAGGTISNAGSTTAHLNALVMNGGTLSATTANASVGNWNFDFGVSTPGTSSTTSTISGGNAALTQTGGTTFNIGTGDTLNVSAVLAHVASVGDTGLIKSGAGLLTLSGTNTFTGGTIVNQGTLFANSANTATGALGGGNVTVNNGGTITVGTDNSLVGFTTSGARTITINTGGTISNAGSTTLHLNALVMNGGTLSATTANASFGNWDFDFGVSTPGTSSTTSTISGGNAALTQTGGTGFNIGTGDTLNVSTVLAHAASVADTGLVKSGGGLLTLSGTNTYTGGTIVNQGTLAANAANTATGALGGGNVTVNNGGTITVGGDNSLVGFTTSGSRTVTINAGGTISNAGSTTAHLNTLVMNGGTLSATTANASVGNWNFDFGVSTPGTSATTSTISGGNAALTQTGGTTFNIGTGDTLNVSAVLAHTASAGDTGLIKSGNGTLALTGVNTYTSATTVTGGTLVVNGSIATSSLTTVQTGATLKGIGTVGALTINAGGTLAPGNSPGIINTGNYNQAGTLAIEIATPSGSVPGTDYDQVNVTGTVTLTGSLSVNYTGGAGTFNPAFAQKYTIIENDGGDAVSGTFSGLPAGTGIAVDGKVLKVYYDQGSGNDVVLVSNSGSTVGSTLYVNNQWTSAATVNGDLETNSPTAFVGVNAFATPADLLAAQPAFAGNVIVNGGTYASAALVGGGNINLQLVRDLTNAENNVTIQNLTGSAGDSIATRFHAVAGGDLTVEQGTFAGSISGTGNVTKTTSNTLTLSGTNNSYSGVTTFAGGIVNVASFSNYGVNGSLGNRAADAAGNVGLLFQGGTLQYTGSTAQSTDRAIRVSTTGGAFIDASGSNSAATLSFTRNTASPDFFENPGARQITFTGTNTGNNTFAMPIADAGGATTVNKTGTGTWVLSGASTYSGGTNISNGVLRSTTTNSLGTGLVTISGGSLTIDYGSAGFTFSNAITGGGSVNLTAANSGFAIPVFQPSSMAGFTGTVTIDTGFNNVYYAVMPPSGTTFDGSAAKWVVNNQNANSFVYPGATATLVRFGELSGTGTVAASNANSTLEVGALNTDSNFSGVLKDNSFGGVLSLAKVGSGTLTLSGSAANTYTGNTAVNSGVLLLSKTAGVNAIAGNVTVGDGTSTDTLRLNASNQIADTSVVTVNGPSPGNSGKFELNGFNETVGGIASGGAFAVIQVRETGSPGVNSTLTVNTTADRSYSGIIRNDAGGGSVLTLNKSGAGFGLFLDGGSNSYSGGTNIANSGGFIRMGNSAALGTGTVNVGSDANVLLWFNTGSATVTNNFVLNGLGANFSGGAKDAIYADGGGGGFANYTISGNITLNANSDIGGNTANNLHLTGQITGTGGFSKGSARADENNTLFVEGTNNSYSGVTTFTKGAVNVANLSNYGVNGSLGNRTSDAGGDVGFLFRGGALQYTGSTAQSTDRAIRLSIIGGGGIIDASGSNPAATLSFTRTTASPDFFEFGGNRGLTLTGSNTGPNLFAMPIQNAGGVTNVAKTGSGRWVLTGASTYVGQTFIQQGILQIENSTALGAGGFVGNELTLISNGAALHLNGNLTVPEHIHLQGVGPDSLGAIRSLSGTSSLTNHISLDGATTIGVNGGSQLTISGQIYDNVAFVGNTLTKLGAGTLTLSHPGTFTTPYSGATLVQQGTLEVTVNGALGGTNGDTTVSSGARLLLTNTSYTTTEALNLNGSGIGAVGTDGALYATGTSRWDGNITAQSNATIFVPTGSTLALGNSGSPGVITKNNVTLTFDGGGVTTVNSQITGATDHTSDLDITGGSTVILTNINNNYMGPTNIINGTLQNGLSNVVPNGSELTFGSAGAASTYDLASFSETIRGLSSTAAGNGVVRNSVNATNSTLTLAPQGVETWTFTGAIQQNPGTVNVVMNGAPGATQRLGGVNTYTGATTVTSGTLEQFAGSLQNASITVNGGTFLQSGGTNNVTGVGGGDLTITGAGVYSLTGGTLDFHDYSSGSPTTWTPDAGRASTISMPTGAQFSFTGGTLQDVSTITVADNSAFTQNGGTFVIGQDGTGPAALTTINGGFSLLGGIMRFDAFGPDATPEQCCDGVASLNDQVTVNGDLLLDSTVSLDFVSFTPEFGDAFTLFCADTITLGDNFGIDGGFFRVIPDGQGGFALQAIVPEPASVAVWTIIGLAGAAGAWRLRKRKNEGGRVKREMKQQLI